MSGFGHRKARRRLRPASALKRRGVASVPSVPFGAPAPAGPAASPPSGGGPRFRVTAVEFSLLWVVLIGFWLFTGPRNTGAFPLPIALAVCGATLFSLIVIGRRWPFVGMLMLSFVFGLFGGRGRGRW
jgi:hypothetical protein